MSMLFNVRWFAEYFFYFERFINSMSSSTIHVKDISSVTEFYQNRWWEKSWMQNFLKQKFAYHSSTTNMAYHLKMVILQYFRQSWALILRRCTWCKTLSEPSDSSFRNFRVSVDQEFLWLITALETRTRHISRYAACLLCLHEEACQLWWRPNSQHAILMF